MTDADVPWRDALTNALTGLAKQAPRPLLPAVSVFAGQDVTQNDLEAFLGAADENDPALIELRVAMARWDQADLDGWDIEVPSEAVEARTALRRAWVVERLGLTGIADLIAMRVPVYAKPGVIITKSFEPWYSNARTSRSQMYWRHYEDYLRAKDWSAEAIAALDETTTEVVERLADPTRLEARQTKGLVVGYVQSGKTANFTGVLAKSIDAGYRMVIVLTGTIELLRGQTQRRIDMELVGHENIVDGLDMTDPQVVKEFDYQQDADWLASKFIRHGSDVDNTGVSRIRRVTTYRSDYKRLPQGLSQLRFNRRNRTKPFNDPENLFDAHAYVAVVKKNKASLTKLIKDLKPLRDSISELPILIIDDESDQASVDTTNPDRWKKTGEARKRTAINQLLSELMVLCPRAQYVGYTATPFANVFIDPDDDEDLFPANFLLSLRRPPEYMGVADFHDVGRSWDDEDPTFATSNRMAHVRPLKGDPDSDPDQRDAELKEALDAFVLSGAIKLFREANSKRTFKHHTMLVHESVRTSDHRDTAEVVRRLWALGAYSSAAAAERLEKLWASDFQPVCEARRNGEPVPGSFDELVPYIGDCVGRITRDTDPVIVVNSDQDVQKNQKKLDFETESVWRILVGGAQLSRGFTVQDLTISYFRRKTLQADTLMQAGRWFGFRPGYRDLVRLYIRRDERVDLYSAFEALLLDEEAFRDELRRFEGFDADGQPQLEPWQIPPLVSQHLPWLRPTARTKMWNAVIETKGVGGRALDYYNHPSQTAADDKAHNIANVGVPLLASATTQVQLAYAELQENGSYSGQRPFSARVGLLEAQDLLKLINPDGGMRWHPNFDSTFGPVYRFLKSASEHDRITDWLVVWPTPRKPVALVDIDGLGRDLPVITRSRRKDPRTDFVGSDSKHRYPIERLAGLKISGAPIDDETQRFMTPTRGGILVYLVDDRRQVDGQPVGSLSDPGSLVVLFSLAAPAAAVPRKDGVIKWTVKRSDKAGTAAVRVDAVAGEVPQHVVLSDVVAMAGNDSGIRVFSTDQPDLVATAVETDDVDVVTVERHPTFVLTSWPSNLDGEAAASTVLAVLGQDAASHEAVLYATTDRERKTFDHGEIDRDWLARNQEQLSSLRLELANETLSWRLPIEGEEKSARFITYERALFAPEWLSLLARTADPAVSDLVQRTFLQSGATLTPLDDAAV